VDPRLTAARIVAEVLGRNRRLDQVLAAAETDVARRDRGLLRELCYGVMRWYFRYDYLLRQWLKRPLKPGDDDLRALILCGMYQLEHLRIPDHAAVAATVEAARALNKPWAANLINALLRRFQREAANLDALLAAAPGAFYAHPDWLLQRLREQWPEHWQGIVASNNHRPPLHLRVNPRCCSRDEYLAELQRLGIPASASGLSPWGVRLEQPVDVDAIPGFAGGQVSVQDFGAQLAAPLLDLHAGERILDACAAPGGKTGHILEIAPGEIDVTAVESDAQRLPRLQQNRERLGFNAKIIHSDIIQQVGWWDGISFDRVLLDVPCSGTGVIRRHPDIKILRSPEQVTRLAALQRRILDSAWTVLKPGGRLVYATCSLLDEEGDGQIAGFIRQQADAGVVPIDADWGEEGCCGRWLVPGSDDTDGFYYAVLAKSGWPDA